MQNIIKISRYGSQLLIEKMALPKKNHLPFFYKQLDCHYIDIISRKIGRLSFDLIIDDEGKNAGKDITAIMADDDNNIWDELAGSFLITTHDDEGNTLPLTEEQQAFILSSMETTPVPFADGFYYRCVVLRY